MNLVVDTSSQRRSALQLNSPRQIWSNESFGVCGSDVVFTLYNDEKKVRENRHWLLDVVYSNNTASRRDVVMGRQLNNVLIRPHGWHYFTYQQSNNTCTSKEGRQLYTTIVVIDIVIVVPPQHLLHVSLTISHHNADGLHCCRFLRWLLLQAYSIVRWCFMYVFCFCWYVMSSVFFFI